jgi:hypothetical protein
MEAYGYKQQIITDLSSIDNNSNNFYNYKNLNFLSKLNLKNENIIICFHGAVPGNGKNRIVFRGYNYNIDNTNIICICDYLLNVYDNYSVNWTLPTRKFEKTDKIYNQLFTYLLNQKKYNKIIFTGTSAGGYPSLKFACIHNSIALLANSQIYLEKYGKGKKYGFYHLKNMLKENNDKIIYKSKQIESIIKEYKPKKIIIYCNKKDSTYKRDIKPLIKFIEKEKINYLFDINLFKYDGIIPNMKKHHNIQFPNDKKHKDILSELLI